MKHSKAQSLNSNGHAGRVRRGICATLDPGNLQSWDLGLRAGLNRVTTCYPHSTLHKERTRWRLHPAPTRVPHRIQAVFGGVPEEVGIILLARAALRAA